MGANSSPPASDAAMAAAAAAALKNKKRKTSDAPLPASLTPAAQFAAEAGAAANAESLQTEATLERMATALDLSHSLLDRALLDPTLPKSTSLAMEDSRSRLEQFSSFIDALRSADVDGVVMQLQSMFVNDTGVLTTLRDAADRAVTEAANSSATAEITRTRRISSASMPPVVETTNISNNVTASADASNKNDDPTITITSTTNANTETTNDSNNTNESNQTNADINMEEAADGENDDEEMDPRASLHEEAAAQALTGLRLSSAGPNSSAAAAAAAAVAAVAAAGIALPSPRPPKRPTVPSISTASSCAPSLPTLAMPTPPTQAPPSVSMLPVSTPTNTRNLSAIPSSVPYNGVPLPSLSPSHALSIFAPQTLGDLPAFSTHTAGLFVTAPPHSHGHHQHSTMAMSPGALPSIFARGLLAPIATPYDPSKANEFHGFMTSPMVTGNTPLGTPMLTPHGQHLAPFVDWKSLTTPMAGSLSTPSVSTATGDSSSSMDAMDGQPTLTPVTNLYHASPQTTGQASPVKSKSITSKQLVAAAQSHGANLQLPIAKSLAALERTHPARKANPRRWTKEEDDALRKAVENHKEKNWKAIAAQVAGRNHTQCLQRWTKVLAPGLVKGHWSPHEDELLKRLVAGGNKNWGEVAAKIPGRTSKQCRERWHNHLDPNIVRGAYSPEEDRIILEAQARLGNRWSVIAAMLPGRTEDAVKIRWKSHCRLWKARKYLRKGNGTGAAGADGSGAGPMGDGEGEGLEDVDSSDEEDGDNQYEDDDGQLSPQQMQQRDALVARLREQTESRS